MLRALTHANQQQSFLSTYRIPVLDFSTDYPLSTALQPIWDAMREGKLNTAMRIARDTLQSNAKLSNEASAALLLALAEAELRTGATDTAKRLAGRSLDLFPRQIAAHRVLLGVLEAKRAYQAAYLHLTNLPVLGPTAVWDEPMKGYAQHIALSAWAWMLGEWESVANHLMEAYPEGAHTMPHQLQEDWFRLALYRGRPNDAAAVAELLIEQSPIESTDALLQTIVQSGWTKEALPLYRKAFAGAPKSQLLRRRLVALYIREGDLEEARRLTQPGALGLAA